MTGLNVFVIAGLGALLAGCGCDAEPVNLFTDEPIPVARGLKALSTIGGADRATGVCGGGQSRASDSHWIVSETSAVHTTHESFRQFLAEPPPPSAAVLTLAFGEVLPLSDQPTLLCANGTWWRYYEAVEDVWNGVTVSGPDLSCLVIPASTEARIEVRQTETSNSIRGVPPGSVLHHGPNSCARTVDDECLEDFCFFNC